MAKQVRAEADQRRAEERSLAAEAARRACCYFLRTAQANAQKHFPVPLANGLSQPQESAATLRLVPGKKGAKSSQTINDSSHW